MPRFTDVLPRSKQFSDMKGTTEHNTSVPSGDNSGKQLRATGLPQSESYTTNIPPRLPEGYSYSQASNSEEEPLANDADVAPSAVSDTEADFISTPLRSGETVNHTAGRAQKPQEPKRRKGGRMKRIAWSIVLVVFILASGAAFHFWGGIPESWRRDEPQPVVAADTLPRKVQPKPQPVDTTTQVVSPEDSMRIQDSIRHARWLYWQRHRRNASQAEEAQEQSASPATETSDEGASHTVKHTPDSVR